MEIQIAIAKVDKFGSTDCGDTVEIVEKLNGGVSVVLADGQHNTIGSKTISIKVAHNVISLIGQGVPDGSACKAISNMLYKEFSGQVSASINILSCDLIGNTITITRNSSVPLAIVNEGILKCLDSNSQTIGLEKDINPSIYQIPLEGEITIILFTDGVTSAGQLTNQKLDLNSTLDALFQEQEPTAQETADFLLNQAILLDENKPKDDMCVVVLQTIPYAQSKIRYLSMRFPK
jgi:serine phosphatase RsbU (regulator of sigma subunit)